MTDYNNSIGVKRIEKNFEDSTDQFYSRDTVLQEKPKRKIRFDHLTWIPSLLYSRLYRVLPRIFKDIFFWLTIIHKSPASNFFANTRYDELRTLIDIKVSSLFLRAVPSNFLKDVTDTFKKGFYSTNLGSLSEIDLLIEDVVKYSSPSHAGARPYFKDGKNKKIDNSFSAYYTFSREDVKKINLIFSKILGEEFNYHLSALAGYECSLHDITYSLSIVFGENSNSEMHQDTYASVAKGFIYLQDIGKTNSPFEYLEGSYKDASFRSIKTNNAVIRGDFHSSGSTRLRGEDLLEALENYRLQSFQGSKGLFILANTAGYHRKGKHESSKPRILLACGVKRRGVISKLIFNFLSICKTRFT